MTLILILLIASILSLGVIIYDHVRKVTTKEEPTKSKITVRFACDQTRFEPYAFPKLNHHGADGRSREIEYLQKILMEGCTITYEQGPWVAASLTALRLNYVLPMLLCDSETDQKKLQQLIAKMEKENRKYSI